MKIRFELRKPHLKVFSAACSNLVVVWLVSLFATNDFVVLTRNLVSAMLFWYLAVKTEDFLEQY